MAFVSGAPVLAHTTATPLAVSSFTSSPRKMTVAPSRSATLRMSADKESNKIPQGFTSFSEQLNGRAAMMGFILALATEALTGKGIIGQVASIGEVINAAKAGF